MRVICGGVQLSVTVQANVVPPPGSTIVIEGVQSRLCALLAPSSCISGPDTHAEIGDAVCYVAAGGHGGSGWEVGTRWVGERLVLDMVWPQGVDADKMVSTRSSSCATRAPVLALHLCHFSVPSACTACLLLRFLLARSFGI